MGPYGAPSSWRAALVERISSLRNPLVRDVVALHRARARRERGQIVLEGPKVVDEALAGGLRPTALFAVDPNPWSDRADRVVEVTADVLAKLATTKTPQEPVAVAPKPEPEPPIRPLRLVAWQVADPGNLGTMVRSAAAFGADVVVGGVGSADPWSPKALRAGAGAQFRTAVSECDDFDDAVGASEAFALVVRSGDPVPVNRPPSVSVVVGSEAHGLEASVIDRCTPLTIPMPGGTESLNAAVAASVALYEFATS